MNRVRVDKKINRLTCESERPRGKRLARSRTALFKYIDRSGWEKDTPSQDFDKVLKKLRKLRKTGRGNAIIVDADFCLRF